MRSFFSLILIVFLSCSNAQTLSVDELNVLWEKAENQTIYDFAQKRLGNNKNDIVGLILLFEYQVRYFQVEELPVTIKGILIQMEKVEGAHFDKVKGQLKFTLKAISRGLNEIDESVIEKERVKASIKGKSLGLYQVLKALELDGFISE